MNFYSVCVVNEMKKQSSCDERRDCRMEMRQLSKAQQLFGLISEKKALRPSNDSLNSMKSARHDPIRMLIRIRAANQQINGPKFCNKLMKVSSSF